MGEHSAPIIGSLEHQFLLENLQLAGDGFLELNLLIYSLILFERQSSSSSSSVISQRRTLFKKPSSEEKTFFENAFTETWMYLLPSGGGIMIFWIFFKRWGWKWEGISDGIGWSLTEKCFSIALTQYIFLLFFSTFILPIFIRISANLPTMPFDFHPFKSDSYTFWRNQNDTKYSAVFLSSRLWLSWIVFVEGILFLFLVFVLFFV